MNTVVYLSALGGDHQVTVTAAGNGRYSVKGLPVLRTGTWKGKPYTEDALRHYSETFRTIRDAHAWMPPVRPKHIEFDAAGQPLQTDARDLLGAWTDLYTDAAGGTLLADAEVNEATATGLLQGTMRFVSSELSSRLKVGGQDYADVFSGAAFVEHPAVTGMPWSVVCNSEDFPEATPPTVETEPQGGESHMNWIDKLKARFAAGETPTAGEVATLLAEDPEGRVEQLAEQMAAERTARETAEAELAQLREAQEAAEATRATEAHEANVTAQVDALLSEYRILPAQRDGILAAAIALRGQEVVTLAEDGAETRTATADVLLSALREGAAISEKYFVQLSSAAPDAEAQAADASAMADRMAASQGFKP